MSAPLSRAEVEALLLGLDADRQNSAKFAWKHVAMRLWNYYPKLASAVRATLAERDQLFEKIEGLEREKDTLAAQVAEMRAALEPFAEQWNRMPPSMQALLDRVPHAQVDGKKILLADASKFREAAAALALPATEAEQRAKDGAEALELLEWADKQRLVIMQRPNGWTVIRRTDTKRDRMYLGDTLLAALRAAKESADGK